MLTKFLLITFLVIPAAFYIVLFVGYETSYSEHDAETTFFIKKYPSTQMQFYDIYNTTTDWPPLAALSPGTRERFADYCKYRFGITNRSLPSLDRCNALKEQKNPYLFRWTPFW